MKRRNLLIYDKNINAKLMYKVQEILLDWEYAKLSHKVALNRLRKLLFDGGKDE